MRLTGGLVDAYSAAYCNTTLSPSSISLNDTSHFTAQHTITIQNLGRSPSVYSFHHFEAASVYKLGDTFPNCSEPDMPVATIRFCQPALTVPAKSSGIL